MPLSSTSRKQRLAGIVVAAGALTLAALPRAHHASAKATWNISAAAAHLDARQTEWNKWPYASRDHDTTCVSCHSNIPYALSRPLLRKSMGETAPTSAEQAMLQSVSARVTQWDVIEPFYSDEDVAEGKTRESYGTESVLNALILSRYGSLDNTFSPTEQKSFDQLWSKQIKEGPEAGAWPWLNFHNTPWESTESPYYGAALAMIALQMTPATYQHMAAVQPNIQLLRTYLSTHFEAQPLFNKVMALWANGHKNEFLTATQRTALLETLTKLQSTDGGWSLSQLGAYERHDKTAIPTTTDACATGLILVALESAGVPAKSPQLTRGLAWLEANQDPATGAWSASSLNKQRDLKTTTGQFMSDAATGYSTMALVAVGH